MGTASSQRDKYGLEPLGCLDLCVCAQNKRQRAQVALNEHLIHLLLFSFTLLKREIPQLPGYGDVFPLPLAQLCLRCSLLYLLVFLGVNESPANEG